MDTSYQQFLAGKTITVPERGLAEQDLPTLAPHLFGFQKASVAFGLRSGSYGLFLDTGLGKTACELEWCTHAAAASNGRALILTPLAVARQIEAEGLRWGYQARVIRDMGDVADGINVCNYDRLHLLEPAAFGAVALDESSILKAFTGATTRKLISAFAGHRWRMAATATPAPNDHMELGQHAEFLGLMTSHEMLMRWFIADQTSMGTYRLKGHAVEPFWDWMASWSRMAEHPRDLGDDLPNFNLPELQIIRHVVEAETVRRSPGDALFNTVPVSATEIHDIKRQTAERRAQTAGKLAAETPGPWVLWCDTDYEADALWAALEGVDGVAEVRGSMSTERKEQAIAAFGSGAVRILITKPSMCGYGLNWQHCRQMAFVGRSFSYEAWYQAVRRCWRFGQRFVVQVHLIVAEGEDAIGRVIDRKSADHQRMKAAMAAAMRRATGLAPPLRKAYQPIHAGQLPAWLRKAS
ncbi:MAG: DEAD/DEAH box helicase [Acidobacteriota bacterium]|nr:DEAD/DEAH box helicase [Acidobacteriota bacterium]